jgi:hypothetical protein
MGLPVDRIKNNARQAWRALAETRLTLFGVAILLVACAIFGAAIPQAMPGLKPNEPDASAGDASVTRMPRDYLAPLLGKEVRSMSGADIGQVAGVLVDTASEPRAVIIRVGGFLGVGVRTVAVDWQNLRVPAAGEGHVVLADLAPQQLARAPQYRPDRRSIAVVTAPGAGANAPNLGYGE